MKRLLIGLGKKIFSRGECEALLNLSIEFRIARYHRKGLRSARRGNLQRPSKLNLGSGGTPKEGFTNVDLFLGDITLDLRRPLPFDSDCCDLVFSEHCFEHFSYPSPIRELFAECHRVLKPGGVLSFTVPQTAWPLTDYAKGSDASYFKACEEHSWWHPEWCETRLEHINWHFRQGEEHKYAYDEETMRKLLMSAGFSDIKERSFDPSLDSAHREIGSLFIEATKTMDEGG